MERLSKNELINLYIEVKKVGLAEVFMKMVEDEMKKRGITEREIKSERKAHQNNYTRN